MHQQQNKQRSTSTEFMQSLIFKKLTGCVRFVCEFLPPWLLDLGGRESLNRLLYICPTKDLFCKSVNFQNKPSKTFNCY